MFRFRKRSPRRVFLFVGVVITMLVLYHGLTTTEKVDPPITEKVVPSIQCKVEDETLVNTDLLKLMRILKDPNDRHAYAWIRMRINQHWPKWVAAVKSEVLQRTVLRKPRRQRKVLIYLGLLSKAAGRNFAEKQFKGGYLGELVQWSDFITSLFILGHKVTVASEVEQLDGLQSFFNPAEEKCGKMHENKALIYTDIIGLWQIKKRFGQQEEDFRCRLRIMDSFGTEPAFNDREYATTHNKTTMWGQLNLNTQQFLTMFPHSPDNSFAGFVVHSGFKNGHLLNEYKQNIALAYGKVPGPWKGKEAYLKVFEQNGLSVHATVMKNSKTNEDPDVIPKFVKNHGYMNASDLVDLLGKTKIFIGLGEPFEGPGALEAIANGAVFINPKFDPPYKYRKRNKPNERQITSQNPYVETYIGGPYVYTVPVDKPEKVDLIVKKILKEHNFKVHVPFEYTIEGMIQRIGSYLEHQDLCHVNSQNWPQASAVQSVASKLGQSCKDACVEKGLICEPSHFKLINRLFIFREDPNINCAKFYTEPDIFFPAFDHHTKTCTLQENMRWFSCAGEHPALVRVCPCRNFIPGQTALCKGCEFV